MHRGRNAVAVWPRTHVLGSMSGFATRNQLRCEEPRALFFAREPGKTATPHISRAALPGPSGLPEAIISRAGRTIGDHDHQAGCFRSRHSSLQGQVYVGVLEMLPEMMRMGPNRERGTNGDMAIAAGSLRQMPFAIVTARTFPGALAPPRELLRGTATRDQFRRRSTGASFSTHHSGTNLLRPKGSACACREAVREDEN